MKRDIERVHEYATRQSRGEEERDGNRPQGDRSDASDAVSDDLFDEAFLAAVDQAMLARKEQDPFRLHRLPYALAQEIHHDRTALIHQDHPKELD